MINRNRLYSMDTFEGMLYCVTQDERVLLRTDSIEEAKAFYARLEGTLPALIDGPTHSVEQDLLIAEQCINETLV